MVKIVSFHNTGKRLPFHSNTSDPIFYKTIQEVINIFKEWPMNFYRFLDQYSENQKFDRITGIKTDFGSLQKTFFVDNKNESFEFIRVAFSYYIHHLWDFGHHNKLKVLKISQGDRAFVSGREASKILKIPSDKIKALIEKKELDGLIQKINNIFRISVNMNSIEQFQKRQNELMITKDVMNYLGICHGSIKILISNFLLHPIIEIKKVRSTKFLKIQIVELFDLLVSNINDDFQESKDLINTSFVLSNLRANYYNIYHFFYLIKKGYFSPVKQIEGKGIYQFLFDRNEVKESILKYKFDISSKRVRIFNSKDISVLLEIENTSVSSWIVKGFIKGGYDITGRRMFSKEDIEAFKKKYITLKELFILFNINYRKITKRLMEMGIMPVTGKTTDGGHGSLYLRKKINTKLESLNNFFR